MARLPINVQNVAFETGVRLAETLIFPRRNVHCSPCCSFKGVGGNVGPIGADIAAVLRMTETNIETFQVSDLPFHGFDRSHESRSSTRMVATILPFFHENLAVQTPQSGRHRFQESSYAMVSAARSYRARTDRILALTNRYAVWRETWTGQFCRLGQQMILE